MKKMIVIVIIVVVIAIGGIVALTNKSNTPQPASPSGSHGSSSSSQNQSQSTGSINIKDMAFTPSQITVEKGGTVTWTNNDAVAHTVVDDLSDVGGPKSGTIAPGESYSFTFAKSGSFQYHCSIHPSMRGTIVVK